MQRFDKPDFIYSKSIMEIKYVSSEFRSNLDEIAENYGDYEEDKCPEIALWNKPTVALEDWLDENEVPYRNDDGAIYFDLKRLDEIMDLYLKAYSHTGWFRKLVKRIAAEIDRLA